MQVCVHANTIILKALQEASRERGSRNPRPPDTLAFCLRYSAQVASARFSSETDFCSFAILMAAQNEASIGSPQHPWPRETHHGASAIRTTRGDAQIFQSVLPPRLFPEELQRYDLLDIMPQPFVPGNVAGPAPPRLLESLLFLARSTEYLQLCY